MVWGNHLTLVTCSFASLRGLSMDKQVSSMGIESTEHAEITLMENLSEIPITIV